MKDIPTSPRQILGLALTVAAPLAFALGALYWAPPKPGQGAAGNLAGLAIIGAVLLLMTIIIAAMARRHSVAITDDTIVVRHSLYTLTVSRRDVTSAAVRELSAIGQARLTTRKNGIALFGYLSGWFYTARRGLTFCAVSTGPLWQVTFEGDHRCRQLVLSAAPEVGQALTEWAARRGAA